jgi:SAM-dependent methyltransferase
LATSFATQIPTLIYLLQQLNPGTVLDIGKGFGKYGFLIHEYVGIPMTERPEPTKTLAEQSQVVIDAVEIQRDYIFPHDDHLYRHVYVGDIVELYRNLHAYDLILMADVIEHLDKPEALRVARHFLADGATMVIATPKRFFRQDLYYGSEFEAHRSHWKPRDFVFAPWMEWQNAGAGRIYLLAPQPRPIVGFGNNPRTRARRVAGMLRREFF